MITGKTKLLGVIGYPIGHSLSPAIHNAAIKDLGVDYVYIPIAIQPNDLPKAVEGLRAINMTGFNVTIPHKEAIIPLLDEVDSEALIVGAVNTVHNDNGKLKGYNTDIVGFLTGCERNNIELSGKKTALLGAGGAAKAIIYALIKAGVSEVNIGVRTPSKANKLIESLNKYRGTTEITVYHWEDRAFMTSLAQAELVVQTTPLGMSPHIDEMPPIAMNSLDPSATIYDIIYNPAETVLLREAKAGGHRIINGELMLVGQGVAAFSIWTGLKPDEELMCEVLRRELSG